MRTPFRAYPLLTALLLICGIVTAQVPAPRGAPGAVPGDTPANTSDIPREQPATATGFLVCYPGQSTKGVVAVIFTYPSGKVLRFDKNHMHGLKDSNELMRYASSADDQAIYATGDCPAKDVGPVT